MKPQEFVLNKSIKYSKKLGGIWSGGGDLSVLLEDILVEDGNLLNDVVEVTFLIW